MKSVYLIFQNSFSWCFFSQINALAMDPGVACTNKNFKNSPIFNVIDDFSALTIASFASHISDNRYVTCMNASPGFKPCLRTTEPSMLPTKLCNIYSFAKVLFSNFQYNFSKYRKGSCTSFNGGYKMTGRRKLIVKA